MPRIIINNWDGGIQNDPRARKQGGCQNSVNFDSRTDPQRLVPRRNSESGDSAANAKKRQNFCIALRTGTTYSLYALGQKTGATTAEVEYKDLTTGSANDLDDNTWTNTNNNQSSSGVLSLTGDDNLFVYYAQTGRIYGSSNGNIWEYDPSGSAAWDDSENSLGATYVGQGLVHSKDDILYVPYDNKIASKNAGAAWTDAALTVPSYLRIVDIAEAGNYLQVACKPISNVGSSVIYLWDRDASLSTLSESIITGDEQMYISDWVDNKILSISTTGSTSFRFDERVIFRVNGKKMLTITASDLQMGQLRSKQVIDSRLFFQMEATINGTARQGLWSVGFDPDGSLNLQFERSFYNNDTLTSAEYQRAFFIIGNYTFIAYLKDSAYALGKTNDTAAYVDGSSNGINIWESQINPSMPVADMTKKKQVTGVRLGVESLSSGTEAILYYRVDGGTWTEVFTVDTENQIVEESQTDVNGSSFAWGTDYEFKIQAKGATITELTYDYDVIQTQIS